LLCTALTADLANLCPCLKAIPPGIPMLTSVSTSLPAAVASAFSSKVVRSSKKASTSAALFVPAPRSINVAPREKKPLGIAIRPDATPEKTDSRVPTLLLGPEDVLLNNSSIVAIVYSCLPLIYRYETILIFLLHHLSIRIYLLLECKFHYSHQLHHLVVQFFQLTL